MTNSSTSTILHPKKQLDIWPIEKRCNHWFTSSHRISGHNCRPISQCITSIRVTMPNQYCLILSFWLKRQHKPVCQVKDLIPFLGIYGSRTPIITVIHLRSSIVFPLVDHWSHVRTQSTRRSVQLQKTQLCSYFQLRLRRDQSDSLRRVYSFEPPSPTPRTQADPTSQEKQRHYEQVRNPMRCNQARIFLTSRSVRPIRIFNRFSLRSDSLAHPGSLVFVFQINGCATCILLVLSRVYLSHHSVPMDTFSRRYPEIVR